MREIARQLGRNASTVSREIARNQDKGKAYSAQRAQRRYEWRRRACRRRCLLEDAALAAYVQERLLLKWSAEQIAGRAALENAVSISYNTIYRAVARRILPISLHKEMRIKSRRRQPSGNRRKSALSGAPSIHQRPQAANDRSEIGHWESDTVHGAQNTGDIGTHVERATGFLIAFKLKDRRNDAFHHATAKAFASLPDSVRKSFTVDRGPEFLTYRTLQALTGMDVFFCDPGHPGQRGSNENTNGLLRQFFPKASSFSQLSQDQIDRAVDLINNRPRKRFGFRSPSELFFPYCCT